MTGEIKTLAQRAREAKARLETFGWFASGDPRSYTCTGG